jgi:hypothetical protein
MCCERGQATIEWTGLVALVTIVFGALVAFVPVSDGWSFGGWLAHSIFCAFRGGCDEGDDALRHAYGGADAALVRRYAPNIVYEPGTFTLPVDFRSCRAHWCSDAPDDQGLAVHESTRARIPAAAYTHVLHFEGQTFLQYWFYYPDSNTTLPGVREAWDAIMPGRYPGFHNDDWEGYQVRIDRSGHALVRATSHYGYQACKEVQCENKWTDWTGWTRVSKGSHAGHIPLETDWSRGYARRHHGPPFRRVLGYRPLLPGRDLHERTTSAADLDLIPIETLPYEALHTHFDGITPPWMKDVYLDPLSNKT